MQIMGINMSVGINGCLGKPMIREGRGLDVYVRRSLRDVFRKVPTFSLEVKVIYVVWIFMILHRILLYLRSKLCYGPITGDI